MIAPLRWQLAQAIGREGLGGDRQAPLTGSPSFAVEKLGNADALGEAVRAAQIRKTMSQQEVALAAGVGRGFVSELEGGKPTAEIGRVFAVCDVVGLAIVVPI